MIFNFFLKKTGTWEKCPGAAIGGWEGRNPRVNGVWGSIVHLADSEFWLTEAGIYAIFLRS